MLKATTLVRLRVRTKPTIYKSTILYAKPAGEMFLVSNRVIYDTQRLYKWRQLMTPKGALLEQYCASAFIGGTKTIRYLELEELPETRIEIILKPGVQYQYHDILDLTMMEDNDGFWILSFDKNKAIVVNVA